MGGEPDKVKVSRLLIGSGVFHLNWKKNLPRGGGRARWKGDKYGKHVCMYTSVLFLIVCGYLRGESRGTSVYVYELKVSL